MKSIRTTTLIIIISVFLLLVAVSHFVSRQILYNSFEKLELVNAKTNIQRAAKALDAEISSLFSINIDWAIWDESYRFMSEINTEFIEENLVSNFFVEQGMAFVLFLNLNGSLHWGRGYDFAKKEVKAIAGDFSTLFSNQIFYHTQKEDDCFRGIITIAGKSYMITSHRIFPTDHTGPSNGMLVMGKELDFSIMEKIQERTSMSLSLLRKGSAGLPLWAEKVFDENGTVETGVIYSGDDFITSYIKLKDLKNSYSFILFAELERNIYKLGQTSVKYFFVSLLIIGAVFSLITIFLLETKVIGRVKNLSRQVKNLYQKKTGERKVILEGRDELTLLAYEINKMVKLVDLKSNELESMADKLKLMNTHLYELANTDPLTHLSNRRNILENLSSYIEIAKRYKKYFCLCIFDVDDFKSINDNYGHTAGDQVLKDLAEASQQHMRRADKIARIGGEEFLILLSDTDITGALSLCERLRLALSARTVKTGEVKIKYTCSFGVTAYVQGKDTADSIFMRADKLLYRAKTKGKNIVISDSNFFHEE